MANIDPAWFGYGALLSLLAISLVSRLHLVRMGIAVAALLALPVAIFSWGDILISALVTLVLLVNLGQLCRYWMADSNVHFTPEELELRRRHFPGLSDGSARRLIDQGHWITARRGEVLIRENQAAPSLFYLADGGATVQSDGADVGTVAGGALIGEATVLEGGNAMGTVLLSSNARLWFVPAQALRVYLATNPDIAAALHEGFARALRGKLASANARIADRPPLS